MKKLNSHVSTTREDSILPDLTKALKVLKNEEKASKVSKNSQVKDEKILTNGSLHHNGVIEDLCNGISNGKINEHSDASSSSAKRGGPFKQKLVVVTNGPNPLLYISNNVVRERLVPPISSKKIVDTTGAGDSFVGGFLAAMSKGLPVGQCLDCGTWTAQKLLQEKGCTLPSYPAAFLSDD